MEEFYYRICCKNINESASFYTDVFNGEKPELMYSNKQVYCMCKLPNNCWVEIFEIASECQTKTLELIVSRPDLICKKLVSYGLKVEYNDKKKNQFTAEDIDGNKLCIVRRKPIAFMPIQG